MTPNEIRAARILLELDQPALAGASKISVSTLRRIEAGTEVGPVYKVAVEHALRKLGAVVVPRGIVVVGRVAAGGVMLVDKRVRGAAPTIRGDAADASREGR